MRRGAAGVLLGIVVMLVTAQPASAACTGMSAWFGGCKTTPTTAPAPKPAPAPPPAPAPAAPAPSPAAFDPAAATQRLLDLANAERAAVGIGPLAQRADVFDIAAGHTRAMAQAGTIWHNEAYLTQAVRVALAAAMLGENVGMAGGVDEVHQALMASPGHRANILEPGFSVAGMAVARSADGLVYVTQDFVQPNGQAPRALRTAAVSKAGPKPVQPTRPRVASAPKPTAPPTTTPPPTTAAPATTTTTVAAQPDPSVLAAMAAAPRPAAAPLDPGDQPNGWAELAALVLVLGTATGAVRVRRLG